MLGLGLGVGVTHSVSKLLSIIKDGLQMWFDFENPQNYPSKISNGSMEDNSGWIAFGTFSGANVQQQSQAVVRSGSSSWYIKHASDGNGIQNSPQFTVGSGLSYEVEAWIYPVSGTSIKSGIAGSTSNGINSSRSVTAGQWNKISYTVDDLSDSNTAYISFFTNNSKEFYVDDVTIKEVAQVAVDKSTNINHGILKTGKALDFDGSGDDVSLGFHSLDNTSTATVAFWAKPTVSSSSGKQTVIRYGHYKVSFQDNDEIIVEPRKGVAPTATFTISDPNGLVQRYVAVTSGTSTKLYVNGTLIDTITTAAMTTAQLASFIGSATGSVDNYDGLLSDVQVWSSAWDQDDVTFDYDNPQHLVTSRGASSIAVADLQGYWHFSEGEGTTAYDSCGKTGDGTISGASYVTGQEILPQLALMDYSKEDIGSDVVTLVSNPNAADGKDVENQDVRKREHGINFDGTGVVEVLDTDAISPGTGDFSLSCWIKNDNSISNARNLISKDDTGVGNDGFGLSLLGSTNGILFRFDDGSGSHTSTTPSSDQSTLLTNGAWHHIVATADRSGNATLYIDKTSVGTTDISSKTGAIINADSRIYIGATKGVNNSSDMVIDEVLYYNKALTSDEVATNYDAGLSQHKVGSSFSSDFSSDYGF